LQTKTTIQQALNAYTESQNKTLTASNAMGDKWSEFFDINTLDVNVYAILLRYWLFSAHYNSNN